ncbi:uncharacterized protein LOC132279407 [Cornus florida]|uniref:uncharacterized protein LOC132279407 n=1 Tax=Cornus florida TaxID=4283 RepID=UPI002896BCF2|nr:uncharacterized protein LOC132279407 [Cornus florida]XP_059637348.1 uncharacterized protein LOC132279407 [Cornus florida]
MAFASAFRRILNGSATLSVAHYRFSSTLATPKLFIKGETTEEDLRKEFKPFGNIVEVTVPTDIVSGRSKGMAYVTFSKIEDAEKAKHEMNATMLDGYVIYVEPYKY